MRRPTLFFLLLLPILIFLSFNKHSKDKVGTHQSVLRADAACYYLYHPFLFIHGGEKASFPENTEEQIGLTLKLDKKGEPLYVKCFMGPALLQTPFFLTAHALAEPLGYEPNGFSWIYQASVMIAGVFYLWLGGFFLFYFLKRSFFKEWESLLLILILFMGTHLYYYSIASPGMSHVYSFFLFSLLMYATLKFREEPSSFVCTAIGVICGLILLCRPTNAIFFSFPLFLTLQESPSPFKRCLERLKGNPFPLLIGFLALILTLLPQFIFWSWHTGEFFHYPYTGESFTNLTTPQIHKVLFSTKNGLIPYTPMYLLILGGVGKLIHDKDRNGWGFLFLFLLLTYIVSSWWTWYFGCSFGARNYVEYLAPFSIPLGYLLFNTRSKGLKFLFAGLALLFIYANLELVYYYDGCFYGGIWDWETYWGFYD